MSTVTEIQLDDDVFDESFLKELDQLEEFVTSSTQHHHHHKQQPPPQPQPPPPYKPSFSSATSSYAAPPLKPPPPLPRQHFSPAATSETVDNISYSPPRELSQPQRFTNNHNINDSSNYGTSTRSSRSPISPMQPEIDFLKSELSKISKQYSDLKDECSMLRKERDEERFKFVQCNAKTVTCASEAPLLDHRRTGISLRRENVDAATTGGAATEIRTKQISIGIQTDRGDDSASASISGTTSTLSILPKLSTIWSSRSSRSLQRKFAAKLLETCATDFCFLFGCLGVNMTSETLKGLTHVPLPGNIIVQCSTELAKVSQLYSVLNKLCDDIVHVNTFVSTLLDLCELENALVVHRSFRILHVAVHYLLTPERTLSRRDNVQVETSHSGSYDEVIHDSDMGKTDMVGDIIGDEASLSFATACKKSSTADHESLCLRGQIEWFNLFTSICLNAVKLPVGHAKVEAVSVMNIILRGMHPYLERGKFGERCVYEAVAELLKKEAGLFCQKEAVHLLFLLLNCPNILATFCASCKGTEGCTPNDGANSFPKASCAILEGIADCIPCSGHSVEELSLSRNAVIVLAFLASSGISGLEIFLYHKLSKRVNFLGLILQVLVSEIDAEALGSCPTPETLRERTLLIREALILLNRLVSHPAYAAIVLKVFASCKDIASLAINSASRLSKKSHRLLNSDSITRHMRESEVVGLASSFKKRLFTFLRESS